MIEGSIDYCYKGVDTTAEWITACRRGGADGGNCDN
ncbi:uncharacterized protein PgNI_12322 [Pyricularia grisea]|uniref:Uncharacterized protein n=1 Tax=Pyricularia grisea TaxID=148305 RepID=A0A6P8AMY1_PYRGI|nr:uncharacterized protein PgNI_12322 [Pyricularia grisea]TLD03395.1 hypothetical protein PgNI_12322 [Pyricularia grisea]